jgi:hypothetical protein
MITQKAPQRIFAFAAFVVFAVSLFVSVPVYAQVVGATLSGTVTDASGATIPQAPVSIKNVATGISTSVTSNSSGYYTAPSLLPGPYAVTVSAPGFATVVRNGIDLTVGAQQVLNIALQVGQVSQTVEVTGEAPAVETTSSSIGAVVDYQTVVDIPLNGRDWTQLAALQTGVTAVLTQQPSALGSGTAHRATRGNGSALTISGTRPQLNNYRLDGISVVDYAGGSPGSSMGVALGVDAIAEFSVLTANFSAEYGRTAGGVINAITRSGTNRFHGDAYWFLRDEGFDARNFFDQKIAPFHRNQFGGSVGGPIQKNKTFFFTDYEGFRQDLGVTNVDKVPSPDARNGIIHNNDGTTCTIGVPSAGCSLMNSAGTVGVDPLVKPYLGLYPLPNAGLIGIGNTGTFIFPGTNNASENFVTVKIDRKLSEKDTVAATWLNDQGYNGLPDVFNDVLRRSSSLRDTTALEETHVFSPSLVNSLRGGYNRVTALDTNPVSAINPLASDKSLGIIPGMSVAPILNVTGLTAFTGGLGLSNGPRIWNSFQAYDDASLTKGLHSLKFGVAFERMQFGSGGGAPRAVGIPSGERFSFGSLDAFLTNQPKTFQAVVAEGAGNVTYQIRQSLFGVYFQDDWRVRPTLTVNLGLRYEMVTVPTDTHGILSNLQPYTATTPQLGSPYYMNPSLRNFEPRIGFAWDPFHNGKTAVRGAFGIFDALPFNNVTQEVEQGFAPFVVTVSTGNLAVGTFPHGALSVSAIDPKTLSYGSVEFKPHRNYLMIWNLNVEHQFTPSTALTVGYVGNHGVHNADRADDLNDVQPTLTPQGYLWPSPTGSGTRLNPNIGSLRAAWWGGDSEYDALEVGVSKRMSHGLQIEGSYTWSKNIDTGSSNVASDQFTNSISSLPCFSNACRRGLSDFNVGQVLVINYLWALPTPKNWGSTASHVVGGWQLAGITTLRSGIPFTPLIGGDPLGLNNQDPYDLPDRLSGPGCSSLVNPGNSINYIKLSCFAPPNPLTLLGNAGRNSVLGPGLVNFDFSLIKNNYIRKISESFNAQFRAEVFNIFNRPNFGPPINNQTLFDETGNPVPGAGSPDQTSTTSRQIQFALKLIF